MKFQAIVEKRIITGIFKDLERNGGCIVSEQIEEPIFISVIPYVIQGKNDNLLSVNIKSAEINELHCNFWLDSDYFRCTLKKYQDNNYLMPTLVESIDRRKSERIKAKDLSDNPVVIVVSFYGKKLYGLLKDVNRDYIKAEIETGNCEDLDLGESGTASLYLDAVIIGELSVKLCEVKKPTKKTFDIILSVEVTQSCPRPLRKNPRGLNVNSVGINLYWPNHDGYSFLLNVKEVSGLGLSGVFDHPDSDIFPIGFIFQEFVSGARLKLAWRTADRMGFDLEYSSPEERETLFSQIFIYNKRQPQKSSRKKSMRTLSVLTRAGLLKGDRASSFSSKAKEAFIFYRTKYSQRWFVTIQKENFRVSFVKISDYGWMGQEIASIGEKGSGEESVTRGIEEFCLNLIDRVNPSLSILCVIDSSSKFNQKLWKDTMPNYLGHRLPFYSVVLGNTKPLYEYSRRIDSSTDWELVEAVAENWKELFQNSQFEDENLLTAFGLSRYEFQSPLLQEILIHSQMVLKRKVYWAKYKNKPQGILLEIGLPPLSSSTSLVENLYVFPVITAGSDFLNFVVGQLSRKFLGIEDLFLVLNSNGVDEKGLIELFPNFKPRNFEVSALPASSYIKKVNNAGAD